MDRRRRRGVGVRSALVGQRRVQLLRLRREGHAADRTAQHGDRQQPQGYHPRGNDRRELSFLTGRGMAGSGLAAIGIKGGSTSRPFHFGAVEFDRSSLLLTTPFSIAILVSTSGRSEMMPSTPLSIRRAISSGLLTVQTTTRRSRSCACLISSGVTSAK